MYRLMFFFGAAALGVFAFFSPKSRTQIKEAVGPSVVYVLNEKETGGGTGFVVQNDAGREFLVTNKHVCLGTEQEGKVKVLLPDNKTRVYSRVIEKFEDNDLCLAEAPANVPPLKLAHGYSIDELVYAVGHPLLYKSIVVEGEIYDKLFIKLLNHVLTPEAPTCEGKNASIEKFYFLFFELQGCFYSLESLSTTLTIFPGNSGSPMVNAWGNVVGVIFAANGQTNWGSAVPLEYLRELINKY